MIHTVNPNNLAFAAEKASASSIKIIEEASSLIQPTIGSAHYSASSMESKLTHDASFFMKLADNLEESSRLSYVNNLTLFLEATDSLFKEVDAKGRTCSIAVDNQTLTESTSLEIYSKNLTKSINKDFSTPLFEGTLISNNKQEAKLLLESIISTKLDNDLDSDVFIKYALFENTLAKNLVQMAIPNEIMENVNSFINVQNKEYFEIFEENALVLKEKISNSSVDLAAAIAPKLFEEASGLTGQVNKFAGISKVLQKFN